MKARDDWYVDHMQIFEDLNKAIKERYEMIERAVESERKSQHMSRAFTERVEEMVQARSEEMAEEEPPRLRLKKPRRPLRSSKRRPLKRPLPKPKNLLRKRRPLPKRQPKKKRLLHGATVKTPGLRSR